MTANKHGQWIERGTPEYRAYLEQATGTALADDDERISGNYGPPDVAGEHCTYCGSITPDAFFAAIEAGYRMEVADWKYGWPHKVYIDWPNPNPEEPRIVGSTSAGARPIFDEDTGRVVRYEKTQADPPEGFAIWTDQRGWCYEGAYATVHTKFYTEHLAEWDRLDDVAVRRAIYDRIGVDFVRDADRLKWKTSPPGPATALDEEQRS